jgi:CDP-diglyceride synthetase
MTFSVGSVGFVIFTIYASMIIQKMYRFHCFMLSEEAKAVKENVQRDAIIMSCLSLFLEVFGHVFISLPSVVGYFVYIIQKQYIVIVLILSICADFGREQIGMRLGTHYFAKHINPQMRLEGAFLSIITPMGISYLMANSGYFIKIKE